MPSYFARPPHPHHHYDDDDDDDHHHHHHQQQQQILDAMTHLPFPDGKRKSSRKKSGKKSKASGSTQYILISPAFLDLHRFVPGKIFCRTVVIILFGSFVLSLIGSAILNLFFSRLSPKTDSATDPQDPYNEEEESENYIFVAVIFAMISSVISIMGTVFINLIIQWVTSHNIGVSALNIGSTSGPQQASKDPVTTV
ncbi:hypothetical protein PoB_002515700 [Plakobranchus ocellatus]|uniref:Uncharacterized protein n=1 Tax=Plakobranchus ocellatus TaxID=259542 RepID=A0AAV3ZVF1_9GAST|nr:hypothetical protein PoB_002515700 [Plakobranchus ocellatus]